MDSVTGWYGFRNRDLIPSEGRWAERDPLGFAAGDTNLYRYVGNGPIYAVDPAGLDSVLLAGLLGAGQGLLDGAAMLGNAATGGLIGPLNGYVNDTVASNGGVYGFANGSAHVGVGLLGIASGVSEIQTGIKLLGTGAKIGGGFMIGAGGTLGVTGMGVATGTLQGAGSIAAGGGLILGGGYVCSTGLGGGGGGRPQHRGNQCLVSEEFRLRARPFGKGGARSESISRIRTQGRGQDRFTTKTIITNIFMILTQTRFPELQNV